MKKISVISGGSSGLGIELAAQLASLGKNVLILGRDSDRLEQARLRLSGEAHGSAVEALICNVGNEADVRAVAEFLLKGKYVVEYLFNNAGRGLFARAEETTSELIDKIFEANVKGMILLTTEILKSTPETEELTIVNIMSTSATLGRPEETVYCAAKWGARGYTEALRNELKGRKRNVIAVYPGGMRTNFWKVTGQSRETSNYMDPVKVADKIVHAVTAADGIAVTEITINRK